MFIAVPPILPMKILMLRNASSARLCRSRCWEALSTNKLPTSETLIATQRGCGVLLLRTCPHKHPTTIAQHGPVLMSKTVKQVSHLPPPAWEIGVLEANCWHEGSEGEALHGRLQRLLRTTSFWSPKMGLGRSTQPRLWRWLKNPVGLGSFN